MFLQDIGMSNLFKNINNIILEHRALRLLYVVSLDCGNSSLVLDQSQINIFQILHHDILEVENKFHHIGGNPLTNLDRIHCIVPFRLGITS